MDTSLDKNQSYNATELPDLINEIIQRPLLTQLSAVESQSETMSNATTENFNEVKEMAELGLNIVQTIGWSIIANQKATILLRKAIMELVEEMGGDFTVDSTILEQLIAKTNDFSQPSLENMTLNEEENMGKMNLFHANIKQIVMLTMETRSNAEVLLNSVL